MPFGNFQFHRIPPGQGQDTSQGYDWGRSFQRRGRLGRDTGSGGQIQPVRTSSEGYSASSKTDLTVVTGEGDRVTISLAAQVGYAATSRTGRGGSSQTASTSSFSQLKVAVQGHLNDTELKDLGTLLSDLSKVSSQAQSTAAPDASASEPVFAGLTSLAAFAYSYEQTVEAGTLIQFRG